MSAPEVRLARLGNILTNHVLMVGLLLCAAGLPTILAAPNLVAPVLSLIVYSSWIAGVYVLLSRNLKWPVVGYAALVVLASLGFILLGGAAGHSRDAVNIGTQFQRELLLCLSLACWTLIVLTNAVIASRISRTTWGTVGYFVLMGGWPFILFALTKKLRMEFQNAAHSRSLNHASY